MVTTIPFAAPEILVDLDHGQVKEYDEAVDYWSLGATIVSMVLDEVSRVESVTCAIMDV